MTHKVLFVCLGNICRSPTAEEVFRHQVARAGLENGIVIDSAGTAAYHVGEPPDQRAQAAARKRGYQMADLRARQVTEQDFHQFDLVLAMDGSNHADLLARCPARWQHRVQRFLDYAPESARRYAGRTVNDVPDPYYGGEQGFEQVLDLCEAAGQGLLDTLFASSRQ